LLVLALAATLASPSGARPGSWRDKVDPPLLEASGPVWFFTLMTEKADLSGAADLRTKEAKGRFVHGRLTAVARSSQRGILREIERLGADHRSYWIINAVLVRGDRSVMRRLARRDDVARLVPNPEVPVRMPHPAVPAPGPREVTDIEWGVEITGAPDVWSSGFTGEGVVVAGQDTGVDWQHPAIIDQYRGSGGGGVDHDHNWHDAVHSGGGSCGADSAVPCDDHGHGTHTVGTVVGDDGGDNRIGMAPGATWIGCRNMNEGVGSPATYAECFEFFLAPWPVGGNPSTDGDPALAPHVINNSWGCIPDEGCGWDDLQDVVEATRAAGIVVVVSAGNEGASCSTITDPPALYEAAFSVGATDSDDDIANFSSRGPVTIDGSGRMKPDVSAPGVNVRSALPGGDYATWSGTSMAGPHVAGLVALLISADPSLAGDVDRIEEIIRQTARPLTSSQGCGGDGPNDVPNNVFGHGVIDAAAAIDCLDCDDGDPCTIDTCTNTDCTNEVAADGEPCDDGLHCNGEDLCEDGECLHAGDPCAGLGQCEACNEANDICLADAGAPCGPVDGDECDAPDTCDGQGGCLENLAEDGTACDDNNPETLNDVCADGECAGQPTFEQPSSGCGCHVAGSGSGLRGWTKWSGWTLWTLLAQLVLGQVGE
jgi:subtilisin family serine protease